MSFALEVVRGQRAFALKVADLSIGDTGGGSSSTSTGDVPDIGAPTVFGVSSEPVSANFELGTDSALEGETRTYAVRLSQSLPEVGVIDLQLGAASTTGLGHVVLPEARLVFQVGQTEVFFQVITSLDAGGDDAEVAHIELVETPLEDLDGRFGLIADSRQGATSIALTIRDDDTGSGDPPTWSFGVPGSAVNVPEGSGLQRFTIQLDKPALQDETFTITRGGGTAVEGTDYDAFEQTVTIPRDSSQGTIAITFPENTQTPASNPTLTVSGEAEGTAIAGSPDSFEITILDNDEGGQGGGIVRINWSELNVSMGEGESRTLRARLTVNGTPQGFAEAVEVPLTYGGDVDEFTIDAGTGTPDTLLFEAGSADATVVVRSVDNQTPAALSIEFDLSGAPPNLRAGSAFRTTVTSNLLDVEDTTLQVPAMDGANRRMIQGLVAVKPPSETLPAYKLTTGERVQVVGHMRGADDKWIAAYVYGIAPATESIAGEPGALGLEPASSSDPAPAEAAAGFVDSPVISFRLGGALFGERVTHTAAFAGQEGSIPTSQREWTGPNGKWPQVGPEIVHQTEYLMRPMRPGATQSLHMKSPDTLGYVELCETRIAGDPNVILYEGQWVNGAWASQDQPDVDSFAENPYCDGPVELSTIEANIWNGPFGQAGWKLKLIDLHPAQLELSDERILVLKGRAEPYYFPTCQAYTFRFVAVRDGAEPEALERARDYHRCKHIAWAVGGLGSTRNRIYGDTADLTVDWARAGLADPGGGNVSGWRAIKSLGEDHALGYGSQGGCIEDWTGGGIYPFSLGDDGGRYDRIGWQHPIYPRGGGIASGAGIYGSSGHIPWWGYWYGRVMELHKIQCRVRHQYRDLANTATPFWWVLAEDVGGHATPIGGSFSSRTARNRHWHFASPFDQDSKIAGEPGAAAALRLAPSTRPWNTTGAADPDYARIRSFETFHETHMPRERTAHVDAWWGMRSYLGYRSYEGRAASLTRSHSPIPSYGSDSYSSREANFASLRAGQAANPGWQGCGMQVSTGEAFWTGDYLRAWGWLMIVSGGFYSIADDSTRSGFRGEGAAASRGGVDWFRSLTEVLEFICEDTGLVGRTYYQSNPNPWNASIFGATDYCGKTGALPRSQQFQGQACHPNAGEELTAPFALGFHQLFCARGVEVVRHLALGSGSDFLRRALEWHANYIEGARQFTTADGVHTMPFAAAAAFDTDGSNHTDLSGPTPAKSTLADLREGRLHWLSDHESIGTLGWGSHNSKCGWSSLAAFRALGDDSHLDIPKAVYSRSGEPDTDFVAFLMRGDDGNGGIQRELTSSSSSRRVSPLGERSFLLPVLAEYLNRIS